MSHLGLDSASGHIFCALIVFGVGVALYVTNHEYGKEIMAGALGSLWTLLQTRRETNVKPGIVNQADTITVEPAK